MLIIRYCGWFYSRFFAVLFSFFFILVQWWMKFARNYCSKFFYEMYLHRTLRMMNADTWYLNLIINSTLLVSIFFTQSFYEVYIYIWLKHFFELFTICITHICTSLILLSLFYFIFYKLIQNLTVNKIIHYLKYTRVLDYIFHRQYFFVRFIMISYAVLSVFFYSAMLILNLELNAVVSICIAGWYYSVNRSQKLPWWWKYSRSRCRHFQLLYVVIAFSE